MTLSSDLQTLRIYFEDIFWTTLRSARTMYLWYFYNLFYLCSYLVHWFEITLWFVANSTFDPKFGEGSSLLLEYPVSLCFHSFSSFTTLAAMTKPLTTLVASLFATNAAWHGMVDPPLSRVSLSLVCRCCGLLLLTKTAWYATEILKSLFSCTTSTDDRCGALPRRD